MTPATIIVILFIAGIVLYARSRKRKVKPEDRIAACASPCEGCDASCPNLRSPK
jgi:hypothetical protein